MRCTKCKKLIVKPQKFCFLTDTGVVIILCTKCRDATAKFLKLTKSSIKSMTKVKGSIGRLALRLVDYDELYEEYYKISSEKVSK
jgi:hypothetical protein